MFADDHSTKSYYSLTAPPLIDIVWRCLIRREKVYESFCKSIVGGFVERTPPRISNKSPITDYIRTLDLLGKYQNRLNPCIPLWPTLDNESVEYEFDHTYCVSVKKLKTMLKT